MAAVSGDARVHILEALKFELGLVLRGSGRLHLDELNCFLVSLCLLGLGHTFGLLSLLRN